MGTGKEGGPAPFLVKTHQMAEDAMTDDIISWTEDGMAFVVRKPVEFAKELLPLHFKHNNFSSFVRQLNTYGFRKVAVERWEFTNDNFRRGRPDLLFEIKRRRNSRRFEGSVDEHEGHSMSPNSSKDHDYQSFASTSTTSSASRVVDSIWLENEKLKKTNMILCQELAKAKQHNEVLLGFLSKYIDVANLRCTLMGGGKGDKGPMLFGVCLKDVAEEEARKRSRLRGDDGAERPAKMIEF